MNKIIEFYKNISDTDLLQAIKEIKESEITGFLNENSIVRQYVKQVVEMSNNILTVVLLDVQINLLKEAAYRYCFNKTLYTNMYSNIGQMNITIADEEIIRMEKQTGLKWEKDFSKEMFVVDETDYNMSNPTQLKNNYCWVVTTGKKLKLIYE